jgi:hypothetical protein
MGQDHFIAQRVVELACDLVADHHIEQVIERLTLGHASGWRSP